MVNVSTRATEVRVASRLQGFPALDNFEVVETPIPSLAPGQVLVRNLVMSVDPAMRFRMNEVGEVMGGPAVGEVVESTVDEFTPGEHVLHELGWRTHALVEAAAPLTFKVDASLAPLSTYLGVLGRPGLTAYAGLLNSAEFTAGDTVFVSGAAGAVGSLVGQLAKLEGAKRVIGSAGSAEKMRHLVEDLGFDVAFNYKDGPVVEQLRVAAPQGVDVYFDNVGGEHLEAAIELINVHGRIVVCGSISQDNATDVTPGPGNLPWRLIGKRFTMRGLLVFDHLDLRQQFLAEVAPLVADGKLKYVETVVDGIGNAPQAFLGLFSGANTGKMLVRIAD